MLRCGCFRTKLHRYSRLLTGPLEDNRRAPLPPRPQHNMQAARYDRLARALAAQEVSALREHGARPLSLAFVFFAPVIERNVTWRVPASHSPNMVSRAVLGHRYDQRQKFAHKTSRVLVE